MATKMERLNPEYQPIGDYQPAGDYATKSDLNGIHVGSLFGARVYSSGANDYIDIHLSHIDTTHGRLTIVGFVMRNVAPVGDLIVCGVANDRKTAQAYAWSSKGTSYALTAAMPDTMTVRLTVGKYATGTFFTSDGQGIS